MDNTTRSLSELQAEMDAVECSPAQRAALDDLGAHIERYQADPEAHHHTLRERLEAAAADFDADHHALVERMRVVLYDLSNAGV